MDASDENVRLEKWCRRKATVIVVMVRMFSVLAGGGGGQQEKWRKKKKDLRGQISVQVSRHKVPRFQTHSLPNLACIVSSILFLTSRSF